MLLLLARTLLSRLECAVSYLYPALASAKAAVQEDEDAGMQWVTYWIVISIWSVLELLVDVIGPRLLPLYSEVKLVFVLWLVLPRYQGAAVLYRHLIHPHFERYEEDIDGHLADMQRRCTTRAKDLTANLASEVVSRVSAQGSSVKEQVLAHALRFATSAPAGGGNGSGAGRGEKEEEEEVEVEEEEEEDEEYSEDLLVDLRRTLRVGIYVNAGFPRRQAAVAAAAAAAAGGGRTMPIQPCRVRLLTGSVCTLAIKPSALEEEEEEVMFEVQGVLDERRSRAAAVLCLHGKGEEDVLELQLPSVEDRQTLLVGFRLLVGSRDNNVPSQ